MYEIQPRIHLTFVKNLLEDGFTISHFRSLYFVDLNAVYIRLYKTLNLYDKAIKVQTVSKYTAAITLFQQYNEK